MSLSSSVLKLYLFSFWDAKIPISSLKQTVGGHILNRESALLFFQFNFLNSNKYYNMVDTLSFILRTDAMGSSSFESSLLPLSSCDFASYYTGTECIISHRFLCFSGSHSLTSTPLDASSLAIDLFNHSVLLWFSLHSQSTMTGSLDLHFGEEGFFISFTP